MRGLQVAREVKQLVLEFVAVYRELKQSYEVEEMFCMTKKFHDFFHLAQRANQISPTLGSCMLQEDLMGRVKRLVAQCVQGSKPLTACNKALAKYRLALHVLRKK